MSSFIVEDNTINCIVNYIENAVGDHDWYEYKKELLKLGFDVDDNLNWKKELASLMYQLNCAAVEDRYRDGAEEMITSDFCFKDYETKPPIQTFKSLGCFLYQCSEGEIMKTDLFKFLEYVKYQLACSIVDELPEYANAYWG